MPGRPRPREVAFDPFEPERDAESADVAQQMSVDPRRVAHDLTDRLSHRLFGAGLQLHGALARIQDPHAAQHVQAALSDLDLAITELRRAIFDLHTTSDTPPSLDPAYTA
ncbi:histidine kinase [Actinomadura monticuli]|uniref:Histidine kinase dimerization/phosphoacceptor domain-containing protein n=1 Tax=Actinomadura monticuli TaxID=3097367 RepID=A0ABV4QJM6_9ACTN